MKDYPKKLYGMGLRETPYDPAKCAEEVSERDLRWPTYHQCDRNRGHGPEGLFCKQHAKKHGKGDVTLWAASMNHDGEAVLVEVEGYERPKTYVVDGVIVGKTAMEGYGVFYGLTRIEALNRLLGASVEQMERSRHAVAEAEACVMAVRKALGEER